MPKVPQTIFITLLLTFAMVFPGFSQVVNNLDDQLDYINRGNMASRNQGKEQDLVFFFYRYKSEVLDLRHFKKYHTTIADKVPDELTIVPPKQQGIVDMAYAVAYLYGEDNEETLLVMLIGNYFAGYPSYFIDYNLDGDYSNDGAPFIFVHSKNGRSKKQQSFELEKNGKKFSFILLNHNSHEKKSLEGYQAYSPAVSTEEASVSPEMKKLDIRDLHRKGLYAGIDIYTGGGKIEYNHNNGATEYTTFYDVDYNPIGIALSLSYVLKNFQLGVNFSHESINYYSSQKKVELGEPIQVCVGSTCTLRDNSQLIVNRDILPTGRTTYGINVSYNAIVNKYIALAPQYRYQIYSFSKGNRYIPSKASPDTYHSLENLYMNSVGLMAKFIVTKKSMVYILAEKQFDNFTPIGFAEASDAQNFKTEKQQTIFSVGYQFKVF